MTWRREALAYLIAVVIPTVVFLIVIGSGYDGKPFLRGDCPYYVAAARTIAEDRDLDLENQLWQPWRAHNTNIALDQQGRFVPKHPLWMPLATVPLLLLWGDQGALIFNVIQLGLLCSLMFMLAHRIAGAWPATAAVCLTATLSFIPHFAWNYSPDVFTAVLLLAALVALPPEGCRALNQGRHILAGLLLGLAVTAKPSFALAALALPLLIGRPWRRTMPALALGGLLPVVLWLGLNQHLFGNPLVTPYDRIVHFTPAGIELHSNREDFTEPLWRGARDQLIRPGKGLLPTSPITVVSYILLPLLWLRDRRWAAYVGITALTVFLFYSTYAQWVTSHWGNRFLMPIVVLGALPLAAALDRRRGAARGGTDALASRGGGRIRVGDGGDGGHGRCT